MNNRNLETQVLNRLLLGAWQTCIELHLELGWPNGERVDGFGIAPITQTVIRLVTCGYVERRHREVPGAVFPPNEYGITEAGLAFMDVWKDDEQ